jgi:tetratricopeptide (TPR) repeat protein
MTPREAADRLFNRIMTAAERGNTQEALRFAPMALQAYELLGPLDNDTRYHVGLIHATAGDIESARAYVAILRQSVPDHLLGIMLEHTIAKQRGDQDRALHAYKTFLAAYESEIAMGRAEYGDHQSGIDSFRRAAKASIGGNP